MNSPSLSYPALNFRRRITCLLTVNTHPSIHYLSPLILCSLSQLTLESPSSSQGWRIETNNHTHVTVNKSVSFLSMPCFCHSFSIFLWVVYSKMQKRKALVSFDAWDKQGAQTSPPALKRLLLSWQSQTLNASMAKTSRHGSTNTKTNKSFPIESVWLSSRGGHWSLCLV